MAKRRRLIPASGSDWTGSAEGEPRVSHRSTMMPPIAQVAAEASAHAALDEISGNLVRARNDGRLVLNLPLAEIDETYLVRDRLAVDDEEMALLTASIAASGQRMPIEVVELEPGRFGLISGWRRMQALRRLEAAEGSPRTVLALLRRPESASQAYVAMVEENEIRQGLSYWERARIAARAVDLGVFESEKIALQQLFAHASRPRRSKIGSFLGLYRALGEVLQFPTSIPERLGLALEKALEVDPETRTVLLERLSTAPPASAAEELAILQDVLTTKPDRTSKQKAAEEISSGLFLARAGGNGKMRLTLSGPSITPALEKRLREWLSKQGS